MQPAFTDPSAARNEQYGNWDYLAISLNLFGLSIFFIICSFFIGILGTGRDTWRWLTDTNDAKET